MRKLIAYLKVWLFPEPPKVRAIRRALRAASANRPATDRFSTVICDYPVLIDLAKAYIDCHDWESAQEIIRTCFSLREEYAQWGGHREAFLVKKLAAQFSRNGRNDIAQHIMKKAVHFEAGMPSNLLSSATPLDSKQLQSILESLPPQE